MLRIKKWTQRASALLTVSSILLGLPVLAADTAPAAAAKSTVSPAESGNGYAQYKERYSSLPYGGQEIVLSSEAASGKEKVSFETVSGKENAAVIQEGGYLEWTFTVPSDARYQLVLDYCGVASKGLDMEMSLLVDGKLPFTEADRVFFTRTWKDSRTEEIERFETDNRGNERMPRQTEIFSWSKGGFRDKEGYFDGNFDIGLKAGTHTVRITSLREPIAVSALTLTIPADLPVYEEPAEFPSIGYQDAIEAELTAYKSSAGIYPVSDKSGPAVSPADPTLIKLNTVGGGSFKFLSQWISWEFTVPETGYYTFGFVYKQDQVRGMSTARSVTFDDEMPFRELNEIKFPYGEDWQIMPLAGGKEESPYKVYLEKGKHTIRLEVRLGEIAPTLQTIDQVVYELNNIYRTIVMRTGVNPDPYQDYYLDREIPNLLSDLERISAAIKKEAARLEKITGQKGSEVSFFYEMTRQLDDFIKEPHTIQKRLDRFKQNISGLAELMLRLKEQPLQLDRILVHSADMPLPTKTDGSFWDAVVFRFQSFIASFFGDYSNIGNVYDDAEHEPLEIWLSVNDLMTTGVSSGRDQAEVLKRLIDDQYTKETGIPVNLSLVNTSDTLMQAIIGGHGPDAALFVPKTMPINLAMRGALADLSKMKDFDEISKRFYPSAFVAFTYESGIYAMPETQAYNMLFYRKDIFEELGLTPPETWDDFYDVTAKLQKKNMQVGIPENQMIFEMLLMQNGGSVYNEALSETQLTTTASLEAFRRWTDLYIQYSLPLEFDFFNRFRTGEMPMGITQFTVYNQLSVAAPEIRRLWEMRPIPGVPKEDGTLNHTQSSNGTGAMIISTSKQQETAYDFIDWWTSAQTQKQFGSELEGIMGSAARYNTANIEAFDQLPWSAAEREVLSTQWKDVWDVPQTPATYYINRNLTNAFRRVVYYNENPREVMNRYAKDMNKELKRKREEFGLEEK